MSRTYLLLSTVLVGACSGGPTGPYDYRPTAVVVHVRFVDLPPNDHVYASLETDYWMSTYDFWPPSSRPPLLGGSLTHQVAGNAGAEVGRGDVRFEITPEAGWNANPPQLRDPRFFAVFASLSLEDLGHWGQPGLLLVYAASPTTWSLFGPGSPTATFPQGYSWLRRTCAGPSGQMQMEVLPIDEVVEFRQLDSLSDGIEITVSPDGSLSSTGAAERLEQTFIASCASTALPDLGRRIGFERVQSLVWAPDGSTLYYLSLANDADPTESVGLRQMHTVDFMPTSLATLAHGKALQIDASGTLYASNQEHLLRVSQPAGAAATVEPLPVPAGAVVSPDGRWLTYADSLTGTHLWNLGTGMDAGVVSDLAGWTTDSKLAYWSSSNAAPVLNIQEPSLLGAATPTSYAFPSFGQRQDGVVWNSPPMLIQQTHDDSIGGFWAGTGLSLVDLSSGIEQPVLDPSVGVVAPVSTVHVQGFLFVLVANCLGLLNTSCSTSLVRIDLVTGAAQTVVQPFDKVPLAVSADGRHVALGEPDGIYVKDLP